MKHAVYYHFNADGALLYIGCSNNPFRRFGVHRSISSWAHEVTRQEIRWFETRELALTEEKQAIQRHRPPFNKEWLKRKTWKRAINPGHSFLSDWMNLCDGNYQWFLDRSRLKASEVQRLCSEVCHIRIPKQRLIALATNGMVPCDVWWGGRDAIPPRLKLNDAQSARLAVNEILQLEFGCKREPSKILAHFNPLEPAHCFSKPNQQAEVGVA